MSKKKRREKERLRREAEEREAARLAAQAPPPRSPAWAGAVRILLGLLLLYSGLEKAAGPAAEFAMVVEGYYLLPGSMIPLFAAILPWFEILVGLSLAAGFAPKPSCGAALLMFASFLFALVSTKVRGIPMIDCGCFGAGLHFSVRQAMGLDSAMLLLSYFVYRKGKALSWLDSWIERGKA